MSTLTMTTRVRTAAAKAALRMAIALTRVVERALMTESGRLEAAEARRDLAALQIRYFPRRRLGPPRKAQRRA